MLDKSSQRGLYVILALALSCAYLLCVKSTFLFQSDTTYTPPGLAQMPGHSQSNFSQKQKHLVCSYQMKQANLCGQRRSLPMDCRSCSLNGTALHHCLSSGEIQVKSKFSRIPFAVAWSFLEQPEQNYSLNHSQQRGESCSLCYMLFEISRHTYLSYPVRKLCVMQAREDFGKPFLPNAGCSPSTPRQRARTDPSSSCDTAAFSILSHALLST